MIIESQTLLAAVELITLDQLPSRTVPLPITPTVILIQPSAIEQWRNNITKNGSRALESRYDM